MVTPRIGRWWYRQASNIEDSRSVQHVVTIFLDISVIWGNTISGIQGNATIFLGYEAPLGFDPLLSTKTLLKLASSGHDYRVWERESKKGGRTYLKDRAGQFTTAKFYCLVKQQFWTPHLYIWRFILNISWSVVHPALNKTCDFRWLRSHSEAHAFETSVGIFRCNPVKSMQQTVLGKGHLNVIIPNDSTDIYIGLYLDSKW